MDSENELRKTRAVHNVANSIITQSEGELASLKLESFILRITRCDPVKNHGRFPMNALLISLPLFAHPASGASSPGSNDEREYNAHALRLRQK